MSVRQSQKASAARAVAQSLSLAALDDDAEDWQKFAGNLLTMLADRLALQSESSGKSVFVYVKRPQQFSSAAEAVRVFDLDHDTTEPLMDRLFLLGLNANGGIALPVQNQEQVVATLESLGIADRPTATFYPADGALRLYPSGLLEHSDQIEAYVQSPRSTFDLPTLIDIIDEFHSRCLVTPQLTNPVFWEDGDKWIPCSAAEKNIQWPLRTAFIFAFRPDVVVKEEQRDSVGNPDFVFYDAHGLSAAPPLAIVEAKVQKSHRTNGAVAPSVTGKELERGLIQTAAYRNSMSAAWGALVCFDLRKPGAGQVGAWARAKLRCQTVLAGLARYGRGGAPDVITWRVFANTEAAQKAMALGSLRTSDPLYPVTRRAA